MVVVCMSGGCAANHGQPREGVSRSLAGRGWGAESTRIEGFRLLQGASTRSGLRCARQGRRVAPYLISNTTKPGGGGQRPQSQPTFGVRRPRAACSALVTAAPQWHPCAACLSSMPTARARWTRRACPSSPSSSPAARTACSRPRWRACWRPCARACARSTGAPRLRTFAPLLLRCALRPAWTRRCRTCAWTPARCSATWPLCGPTSRRAALSAASWRRAARTWQRALGARCCTCCAWQRARQRPWTSWRCACHARLASPRRPAPSSPHFPRTHARTRALMPRPPPAQCPAHKLPGGCPAGSGRGRCCQPAPPRPGALPL